MVSRPRVVITGLGITAPNGVGVEPFWNSLVAGRSAIGPVTLFDASDLPCRIAGEVRDFDPHAFIDPDIKLGKRMARGTQFAVASARMALDDAGLTVADLARAGRIPLAMGVSTSAMDLIAERPRPWTVLSASPPAVASAVASVLGFEARLMTVSSGCASGLDAVAQATAEIRRGQTDLALAGAADSTICRYVFECFSQARQLSRRNDEPERSCRPFDRDRDGGVMAEGAAVVVLECLDRALARGAVPYAEITGTAACGDVLNGGDATGLEHTMRMALDNAPCRPETIDAINAHGPGDPHMDRSETAFIRRIFGAHAYRIPVTSIKGVTGNPMGVGGVFQLVASALTFRHGVIPPTANLDNPDPECDLDYVRGAARRAEPETILVNTHGVGRNNVSVILERCSC
jgi:3-oxoacyl-[acyl-carrier-protein] synthase II